MHGWTPRSHPLVGRQALVAVCLFFRCIPDSHGPVKVKSFGTGRGAGTGRTEAQRSRRGAEVLLFLGGQAKEVLAENVGVPEMVQLVGRGIGRFVGTTAST